MWLNEIYDKLNETKHSYKKTKYSYKKTKNSASDSLIISAVALNVHFHKQKYVLPDMIKISHLINIKLIIFTVLFGSGIV